MLYRRSRVRAFFFHTLSLFSFFSVYLLCHWRPHWKVYLTCVATDSILSCTHVLLKEKSVCRSAKQNNPCQFHVAKLERKTLLLSKALLQKASHFFTLNDRLHKEGTSSSEQGQHVFLYFDFRFVRFNWNRDLDNFEVLTGLDAFTRFKSVNEVYAQMSEGVSTLLSAERLKIFSQNCLDIPIKSYSKLIFSEVLNPFYIFQVFGIVLWMCDSYVLYASFILISSVFSIVLSVYEARIQSLKLHRMVKANTTHHISAFRSSFKQDDSEESFSWQRVECAILVPGDLVQIPEVKSSFNCDIVLLSGSCVVNESMLTGESVATSKVALNHDASSEIESSAPLDIYSRHSNSIIFSGTSIIQTKLPSYETAAIGLVARTGFSSCKGRLLQSIIHPTPVPSSFHSQSMLFIGLLAFVSLLGLIYSAFVQYKFKASLSRILLRSLDIVTIVVPPALPSAMTLVSLYAQHRLRAASIFCTNPARIIQAGTVNFCCFDKTGTLTHDEVSLASIVPICSKNSSSHFASEVSSFGNAEVASSVFDHIKLAMSSCHSLNVINGETLGDPLDVKMFQFSGSTLQDSLPDDLHSKTVKSGSVEIAIIKEFPFSSNLKRMGVIIRCLHKRHFEFYLKGAPEKIVEFCEEASIPQNFNEKLHSYASQGFRVLAVARKDFKSSITWHHIQKLGRHVAEKDLSLLSLLIFKNELKENTISVIRELKSADLPCVMITGDNLSTAISVAFNCGILDSTHHLFQIHAIPLPNASCADVEKNLLCTSFGFEGRHLDNESIHPAAFSFTHHYRTFVESQNQLSYVIDGKTLNFLNAAVSEGILPKACLIHVHSRAKVFARVSAAQKCEIVKMLQEEMKFSVSMCGDGANDASALKASYCGVSLSKGEATLASCFTSSKALNIACVSAIIKEGRCCLTLSLAVFKFMVLYSLIQFSSILILYSFDMILSDIQYLYIDIVLITCLVSTLTLTKPSTAPISAAPPKSTALFSSPILGSMLMHVLIQVAFQLSSIFLFPKKCKSIFSPFPLPKSVSEEDVALAWPVTILFNVSSFQYIYVAVAFYRGAPHCQRICSNHIFVFTASALFLVNTLLTFCPFDFLARFFEVMPPHRTNFLSFRVYSFVLSMLNALFTLFCEALVGAIKNNNYRRHYLFAKC